MDYPYYAFDIPPRVDPDGWARALLAQVERDIRNGRREASDAPRVYISSQSVLGPGEPPQVIAEATAYDAAVKFDIRKFEAYVLERGDLPVDAVEVRTLDRRAGRVFCFSDGLWRVTLDSPRQLSFKNESTGERRVMTADVALSEDWLDTVYASEIVRHFEAARPSVEQHS